MDAEEARKLLERLKRKKYKDFDQRQKELKFDLELETQQTKKMHKERKRMDKVEKSKHYAKSASKQLRNA